MVYSRAYNNDKYKIVFRFVNSFQSQDSLAFYSDNSSTVINKGELENKTGIKLGALKGVTYYSAHRLSGPNSRFFDHLRSEENPDIYWVEEKKISKAQIRKIVKLEEESFSKSKTDNSEGKDKEGYTDLKFILPKYEGNKVYIGTHECNANLFQFLDRQSIKIYDPSLGARERRLDEIVSFARKCGAKYIFKSQRGFYHYSIGENLGELTEYSLRECTISALEKLLKNHSTKS